MSSIISSTVEVSAGECAVLNCTSNNNFTNFKFWILESNKVVGPLNNHEEHKYKYKVLSGQLFIDRVTPEESGTYKCVSQKLIDNTLTVEDVYMQVNNFTAIEGVKFVAIVLSILVIISCAVLYWRLRKQWNKYDGRIVVPVDDPDEDDGDEVYNSTTTTLPYSQPVAGPSRNQSSDHLLYGIDNQGLDTDFNSVFENIQIKSPPSLI